MGALLSGAAAMSANADSLRDGLSKAATQCSEKDEEVYIWLDSCHGSGLISEQAVHASIPTGATLVQSTTCSDSSVPMWVIYMLTSMLVSLVGILVVALCMHVARTARLKNQLLSKALPPDIAKRLLLGEKVVDSYEHAAIVFADIVGYTAYSSTVTAEELVHLLDTFFNRLDIECEECNCLKVKTIGDCYMAAAGVLPVDRNKQEPDLFLLRATLFGWKIVQVMDEFAQATGLDLAVRVGLHQGQVVAGVIGRARFAYDMWGDTVNIASRMEAASEPNKINMDYAIARKLENAYPNCFLFDAPQCKQVKGKGEMQTCLLLNVSMNNKEQLHAMESISSFRDHMRRNSLRSSSFRNLRPNPADDVASTLLKSFSGSGRSLYDLNPSKDQGSSFWNQGRTSQRGHIHSSPLSAWRTVRDAIVSHNSWLQNGGAKDKTLTTSHRESRASLWGSTRYTAVNGIEEERGMASNSSASSGGRERNRPAEDSFLMGPSEDEELGRACFELEGGK